MANEVIKAYDTEANALANGTTGRIDPLAVAGAETLANSTTDTYYIYNKYWYRIESNEPVVEFHIDWDEGENNSPEKASIEIIKLDSPAFSIVTSHVFTEHKHFFPLIRVKSMDGYLSKWYTNDVSTNLLELEDYAVSAGQNEFSIVSKEKAASDRINAFYPSNMPPVGVLKSDIKRIYSSIDNSLITGSYPLLYAFSSSTASTKPSIKFTLQDSNGAVIEHTMDNSTSKILTTTSGLTAFGDEGYMAVNCIPSGNYSSERRQGVQRIQINSGTINSGVTWSNMPLSPNDAYLDIHYESADDPDTNGNYHCRVFFTADNGDGEGAPDGAGTPNGYSLLKVGLGSGTGSPNSIAEQLNNAFDTNQQGVGGLGLPLGPIGNVVDDVQGNSYFDCTIAGSGGITPWQESTDVDEEIDCSTITTGGGTITKTTAIKKLLRVELLNAKNLSDTDRIFIMHFNANINLGTDANSSTDVTIAVLSNGSPIQEWGEAFSQATLDGTESRTRASNVDVNNYYIDFDKLSLEGAVQGAVDTQQSDVLVTAAGSVSTALVNGVGVASYSFDLMDHVLDSDSRFLPTTRLCRLQVVDDSSAATNTTHKDTLTTSAIEGWDSTRYTAAAVYMPSSLEHKDLLLYGRYSLSHTGDNLNAYGRATLCWRNRVNENSNTTDTIMGGSDVDQFAVTNGGAGKHPLNFLLLAKTEKFDRLHLRLDNQWQGTSTSSVEVTAYYTANDGTWKPLEIVDTTQGLKTSGSIKFNMPPDWAQKQKSTIESGTWTGPVHVDNVGTDIVNGQAPEDLWTFDAYGIIIAFNVYGTSLKTQLMNLWPYNNSHSQLIEVSDPHHVSLNDIAIAQSISFGRDSKSIAIEDKFGKTDIRKIGASGGNVTFGGIDFGRASSDERKIMVGYQKNATPVFLDVSHRSGDITRFFGVVTRLTEDHPAGKMFQKWAVTMQISHILELGSDGLINSDKISIGGALVDDGQYIL